MEQDIVDDVLFFICEKIVNLFSLLGHLSLTLKLTIKR